MKAFRFNRSEHTRALILKVDPVKKVVIADGEEQEDLTINKIYKKRTFKMENFLELLLIYSGHFTVDRAFL